MPTIDLEKKHSPELIAEAAMCIWEHMLEQRPAFRIKARRSDVADKTLWFHQMDRLWFDHGTVEMRHYAYRLALSALEVFEELGFEGAEDLNLIPYDWEFIPTVVRHADWSSLYDADNSPERIEREIREKHDA